MKVLTRTQFLALQGPVLYSKWFVGHAAPEDEISIKYDTLDNDWVCQPLSGFQMQGADSTIAIDVWSAVDRGEHRDDLKVDMESAGRDGLFESEYDCKFVVFDADDIGEFMRKMNECFQAAVRFVDAQYMVIRISPMTDVNANLKVSAKYKGVEKEFIYNRIYLNTLKEMIGQRYEGQSWVQVEKYGFGYELIVANPKSEDPIGELMEYLKHESRSRFQG